MSSPLRADSRRFLRRSVPLLALVLVAAIGSAGCAASAAMGRGRDAEGLQDYDRAVLEYTRALSLDPDDVDARLALERAKLRASSDHFQRGRRLAATARYDQALVEYELAAELNPSSEDVQAALRTTRNQLRSKVAIAREEGKTELQTLVEQARDMPPRGLDLPAGVQMPATMVFRDGSSREIFQVIARLGNISIAFDPAFRDTPVTLDLRNVSLEDALNAVANSTRNFLRAPTGQTVLVIPDTPAKRREYEEEVVQTFYLSNADLKETIDLLRLVLDARRISATTGTNALTIKDTPDRVAAAARVLSAIDKARPEVLIDVELLEVDRTKLQEFGLQFASLGSPGIDGSATIAPDSSNSITLQALRNLSQADVLLANLPGLYYRLLKTDTNTRTLANPQLRTAEGMTAQARFGERIPVPMTTFAPIATGGTPQQPITAFNYENIGVNIDITPRTHHDDDVTLVLKVAVQSVSGTGFGELPTFGNREISTVIRLRDGETNMLAGLIRDDERRVLNGIPGLSDIPVVGRLFAHSRNEVSQTDIVLTLTPHIIRVLDLSEQDLRAFRVGRDMQDAGGDLPAFQAPAPLQQPATPTPAAPAAPGPVIPGIPLAPTFPDDAPEVPGVSGDSGKTIDASPKVPSERTRP